MCVCVYVWNGRRFVEGDRRKNACHVKADIKRDDSFVSVYIIPARNSHGKNMCIYRYVHVFKLGGEWRKGTLHL